MNNQMYFTTCDELEVKVYDRCKYSRDRQQEKALRFSDVEGWEVISDDRAKEIEDSAQYVDDYHEYLRLYMKSGATATFLNSRVDLFPAYHG